MDDTHAGQDPDLMRPTVVSAMNPYQAWLHLMSVYEVWVEKEEAVWEDPATSSEEMFVPAFVNPLCLSVRDALILGRVLASTRSLQEQEMALEHRLQGLREELLDGWLRLRELTEQLDGAENSAAQVVTELEAEEEIRGSDLGEPEAKHWTKRLAGWVRRRLSAVEAAMDDRIRREIDPIHQRLGYLEQQLPSPMSQPDPEA